VSDRAIAGKREYSGSGKDRSFGINRLDTLHVVLFTVFGVDDLVHVAASVLPVLDRTVVAMSAQ
jgi:hypothetical protein